MPRTQPTTRRVRYFLAALSAALLLSATALAHTLSYPRMVHVRFGPELVELAIQVTLHAGAKSRALRDRHDVDHDGVLSEEERRALGATLDAEGRAHLRVTVDGIALRPELGAIKLDVSDEGPDGDTLALNSVAAVAVVLLPGVHEVTVEDLPPSLRATVPLRVEAIGATIERGPSEKDAMPLTAMPQGAWLGGFSGDGGTVHFTVIVPPR